MATSADWNSLGNCRHGDPDRLFVTGAKQRAARTVCRGCPVLKQCLAMALDDRIEFGVWGGMTERERRAMLKTRPDITNWSGFLERAAGHPRTAAPAAAPAVAEPLAPVLSLTPRTPVTADPRTDPRTGPLSGPLTGAA
ncbi:MAG TPA: WhiB family transcriptional regulator [Pseudonocardia sp.]|jgi:WhiB family redox-sensing transcriptional regulator